MRILAVAHNSIWPIRSGLSIRRAMILEGLASLGTVDLLYVGEVKESASLTPAIASLGRVYEAPVERVRPSALQRARWAASPRVPLQVMEWADFDPAGLSLRGYDLIWYFGAIAYGLAKGLHGGTTVVDLNDLEDQKLHLARTAGIRHRSARRRFADKRNTLAWARYQRAVARGVAAVTVCSEDDRRLLAVDNGHVVPNGFPPVAPVNGSGYDPSTLLLVGMFEYGPNGDGAEFFIREVFPLIRSSIPTSALRLVGRDSPRVRGLSREGVTVVGHVPDLAPEYDRAAVALAPLRYGSGTRVKILEAFARGVPVVSTTVGAAGLGASDGEHLLLADDPASFATACTSVMTDPVLRERLATNATTFYERRFGQGAITAAVARVVQAAVAGKPFEHQLPDVRGVEQA